MLSETFSVSSSRPALKVGVHLAREGEAPAEPCVPENVIPDSRLSRSFALPNLASATPSPNNDGPRVASASLTCPLCASA